MNNNFLRAHDDKDNLSIASRNTNVSQNIFEGFVLEIMREQNSVNCCNTIQKLCRESKNRRMCASWSSRNDFFYVTELSQPFRIYFDDIISTKKVGTDRFELTVFSLFDNHRHKVIYEVFFHDFPKFEQMFLPCLNAKIPPSVPKFYFTSSDSDGLVNAAADVSQVFCRQERAKALIIINPFSGQKKALKLWMEHAQPIFEDAGIPYKLATTKTRGHAINIAREVNLDEFGTIVIVSGDGLVSEVICGLLTRQKDRERALKLPILHIPGGTSNALAASVAFQCNEPFAARGVFCREMALMLASSRPRYRPLRLYHVETEHNGHLAMFMTMTWGLIADIDLGSERFRWAGMIRLHIEAFLRIMQLPTVARYKGRISFLPVTDEKLLRKTKLTTVDDRRKFGTSHFDCEDVPPYISKLNDSEDNLQGDKLDDLDYSTLIERAFEGTHLEKTPSLSEPVPSHWTTIEGEFVFVCLSAMSHLGSDLPYMPCTKLEEEVFYLTFVDWRTLKSRFHMAQLLITIDRCAHLAHQCLQVIPVLACRVEPKPESGGYVALDGEPCQSNQSYQVVSTALQATIVSRQPR